jgi:hypothetical protein
MAIISLIAGILGFTMLPFLGSIIALITGYMARGETRGNPPTHSGDGLATAGIVMGWIGIGLGVCGLCVFAGTFIVPILFLMLGVAVDSNSALPLVQLWF